MKHFLRIAALLALFAFPSGAEAAARFAVCTVTCTWDSTSTAMWCATDTGCTGASAPAAADTVTFNANTCVGGVTCTITVAATINGSNTIASITMGACTASTTGCILDFSVNNPSVTLTSGFSVTGTGTRALLLGTGTFTTTATAGNISFDCTTSTNMTLTSGSESWVIPAPSSAGGGMTFAGGGNCGNATGYGNLTINSRTNGVQFAIAGANKFASVTINGPVTVNFAAAVTTTITGALTITGTSTGLVSLYTVANSSSVATVSVGSASIAWAAIRAITFSGTAVNPTSSFDLGAVNLNGGSFSAPTTSGGGIIGG
jgi:hypothetical protein